MTSSDINKEIREDISYASICWIHAVRTYMKRHNISQRNLAQKLSISQSTLSKKLTVANMGEESHTYWYLLYADVEKICKAMGTTPGTVMYEYEHKNSQNSRNYDLLGDQEYTEKIVYQSIPELCEIIPSEERVVCPACLFMDDATLVNNKADPIFDPWFGNFHCYFFSTMSTEKECFHGILEIPQNPRSGCCNVKFSFEFGKRKKQVKEYYGQLILSRKPGGGAYCTLINHDELGEITYLVMANPAVSSSCVCCVVALVATISGGKDTKHPCAERMIISRVELSGTRFELVKAHLLLNDKNICITEQGFLDMLENEAIPQEFKQCYGVQSEEERPFDKLPLSIYLTRAAVIPENWVKSLINFSEEEQQKIIDLFRLYSSSTRYNKIKQKTAEFDIFNLFKEEYEPWTLPPDGDK